MPGLDQQLNPAFSPDGKARRLPRDERWAGRHLLVRAHDQAHHEHHQRRLLGLRPGLLSRRAVDLLLAPFEARSRRSSGSTRTAPDSREQITYGDWNDEDPVALPRRKAALLHLRPRPGHLQHLLASTSRRARRSCTRTSWPGSSRRPSSSAKTTRRSSSSRRTTSGGSRSTSPTRRSRSRSLTELAPALTPRRPATSRPTSRRSRSPSIPEKVATKPSQEAVPRGRAGHGRRQHGPDLRLEHDPDLRRQPGRPPLHRDHLLAVELHAVRPPVLDLTNAAAEGHPGLRLPDLLPRASTRRPGSLQRTRQAARYTGGAFPRDLPALALLPTRGEHRVHLPRGELSLPRSGTGDGTALCCGVLPDVKSNYPIGSAAPSSATPSSTSNGARGPGYRFLVGGSYAPDFQKDSVGAAGRAGRRDALAGRHVGPSRVPADQRRDALRVPRWQASSKGNLPTVCSIGGIDTLRGVAYGLALRQHRASTRTSSSASR